MTPQQLYLSSPDRKKWFAETFQSARGEEALYAAFNQYCSELPGAVDGGTAIALNAKRLGALELVQHMLRFTLPHETVKRAPLDDALTDTTVRSGPTLAVPKPKTQ